MSRFADASLAICACLALAACSDTKPPKPPETGPVPTTGSASPAPSSPPSSSGPAPGSRSLTYPGGPNGTSVTFTLGSLDRHGEWVVMKGHIDARFAGKNPIDPYTFARRTAGESDAFALIDLPARMLHFPAKTGSERLCTPQLFTQVRQSTPTTDVTCVFGAPTSSTVTLQIANFGWLDGVPIRDGSGPAPAPAASAKRDDRALITAVEDSGGMAKVDTAPRSVDTVLNANIAFDRDRDELKPAAVQRIREVTADLSRKGPGAVSIVGYTDNLGSHEHGVDLSRRRAENVRRAMESALPGYRFTSEGRAEADPVAPNDSEANRAKNRRVEIHWTR